MPDSFIEFSRITKRFAGVTALDDVSLSIARGETHALMGENGAGKSTLAKTLAGIHAPDAGVIRIDGSDRQFRSPRDAMRTGIGMVHQELAFCPELSVAENLSMGQYPRTLGLFVSRSRMRDRARQLLAQIGVSFDVTRPVRSLSTAQEQLVQIASAVGTGAKVLIFDEPTSSLSQPEAEALFGLMDKLKARGVTMIYVSHRMPEVFRLCDRISVLRDGRHVGTLNRADATHDRVVQLMVGRAVQHFTAKHSIGAHSKPLLKVASLSSPGNFEDVSFEVRSGEIVGLAGLVGAGRSEVAKAIFGLDGAATGSITLDGRSLPCGNIRAAMRSGIGLIPEDRKRQGLVLMMGGRENYSLGMLEKFSRLGFVRKRHERRETRRMFEKLRVKTATIDAPVAGLSGGNQQKVALAKWLGRGCGMLIVDEPTRGVDVGAKAAIHQLLDDLASAGAGVLLISSELPEIISLSSRVLVMREGRLVGELSRDQVTQESVLRLMAGVQRT